MFQATQNATNPFTPHALPFCMIGKLRVTVLSSSKHAHVLVEPCGMTGVGKLLPNSAACKAKMKLL